MAVNKEHPLFQEYYDKCMVLRDEYIAKRKAVRARLPAWQGKDHPANAEIRKLELQHNADLKLLQQEYSCLFNYSE